MAWSCMSYPSLDQEAWVEINVMHMTGPADIGTNGVRKSKGKAAPQVSLIPRRPTRNLFRHETRPTFAFSVPTSSWQKNGPRCITMPSRRLNWRRSGNHRWQQNSSACRWTSSSLRTSSRQTRGGSSPRKWWRHWQSTHIQSCGTEPAP